MRKYEMALLLAQRYGYTSYLEICTSSTGFTFSQVDKQQFSRRVRLMYNRPPDFSDGEPTDFFTEDESGEKLFGELAQSGEKFDVVFIDPFHTYASSLRDIVYGLQLVKRDGVILIHDCFPPNAACTAPEYIPGEWCGVTFAAYLDTVLFRKDIHYVTIDSDYGCGIISMDNRLAHLSDSRTADDLVSQWSALNLVQKYPFFEEHHTQLLNLISPDDFRERLFGPLIPDTLEKTKNDLEAVQRDLLHTRIVLEHTQNSLKTIQHTTTWRMHERFHHISLINKFYLLLVAPIKRWMRSA